MSEETTAAPCGHFAWDVIYQGTLTSGEVAISETCRACGAVRNRREKWGAPAPSRTDELTGGGEFRREHPIYRAIIEELTRDEE